MEEHLEDVSQTREQFARATIIDTQNGETMLPLYSRAERRDCWATFHQYHAEAQCKSKQLSIEEMLEIYNFSDLIDAETFARWKTEAIGPNGKWVWLDEGRLACRFSILADVYQLSCLFSSEFYRQMREVEMPAPLHTFQGDCVCGTSIITPSSSK